jgi:hypothetical protein
MHDLDLTPAQRKAAVGQLWREGRLKFKLHPHQREAYELIQEAWKKAKRFCLNWSRRLGKTFTALVVAVETCLRKRGARVILAAPSGKHLEEFVHPAMKRIFEDAPGGLTAWCRWVEGESAYIFDGGSRIVMSGCDTERKADNLRGGAADGAILEEAGSIPNLIYVRRSIIEPQLMPTDTSPGGGWLLIVSSPPVSVGHPFVKMARDLEAQKLYLKKTIWEGQYTADQVREHVNRSADGVPLEEYMESIDFRREYMAEFISDPSKAVLKYAVEKNIGSAARPGVVIERYRALRRPTHYVGYAGLDVGWSPDATGGLWGYWHHEEQTLVIERELLLRRMTTNEFAEANLKIEADLWGAARRTPVREGYQEPRRWSDHDPRLLTDLAAEYGIIWAPTPKDDRDAAIDALNKMIPGYRGKLAINPACTELLQQMMAAIWNNKRTEFARDDRHLHFDLVAALVYLARNVVRSEDPIPPGYGISNVGMYPGEPPPPSNGSADAFAKLWGMEVGEA